MDNDKTWTIVADSDVANTWRCEECGATIDINPDWYQNNGTPMCCDVDMEYSHTEIMK